MDVYPDDNPFNPLLKACRVHFSPTVDSSIKIRVFDFAGKTVLEENLGRPSQFYYDWNGRDENNTLLANGVYFMELTAENAGASDKKRVKLAILR